MADERWIETTDGNWLVTGGAAGTAFRKASRLEKEQRERIQKLEAQLARLRSEEAKYDFA